MIPKLSIITINFNNLTGLKKTMQSVLSQTFSDYEYIIIDGGSTDGSETYIKKHANKLGYWISEPDKGIYHAMNKGIIHASGEFVLFLNSGDTLYNSTSLHKAVDRELVCDFVYFDVQFSDIECEYLHHYPDILTFKYFLQYSLPHQATFIRRRIFYEVGFYDESLKICADWAFFIISIAKYNRTYMRIPLVLSTMRRDGISCDPDQLSVIKHEKAVILEKEFGLFINDYEAYHELENKITNITKNRIYRAVKKLGIIK